MSKKTIGSTTLRFDELQTVLFEVESILKHRPLVPLDEESLDEPLTPNHLLFGRQFKLTNTDTPLEQIDVPNHLKRLKYIETILDHFWKRWSSEYLTALREYHTYNKTKNVCNIPQVNDVVIIKEDKLPRQQWRI